MKQYRLIMALLALVMVTTELAAQNKKVVTRRTRVSKVVVKQPEPDKVDTVETVIPVVQPTFNSVLAGKWKLLSIRKQQKDEPTKLPDGLFIQFDYDSSFSGFAGCNRFSGTYHAVGATLLLSKITTTKAACEKMDTETLVLKHLSNTIKSFANINYGSIALKDGTGSVVFECERMVE
jgi:heat shock protein HslJ